jgi:hypothetical protein
MQKFNLPYVILPAEFITLLKTNLSITTSPAPIFDVIRPNQALYLSLEQSFKEFDDGRGLEKTMLALGWQSFRERMASMYIYKAIHGQFPLHTNLDLVEDIKKLEERFVNHSITGVSRVFMLGFYLRLANIQIQKRENNKFLEITVPEEIGAFLRLSQGRTEKPDWLILILMHLTNSLGDKIILNSIASGKKLEELYPLMSSDSRKLMSDNLLAYGASIGEADMFLYEKV